MRAKKKGEQAQQYSLSIHLTRLFGQYTKGYFRNAFPKFAQNGDQRILPIPPPKEVKNSSGLQIRISNKSKEKTKTEGEKMY